MLFNLISLDNTVVSHVFLHQKKQYHRFTEPNHYTFTKLSLTIGAKAVGVGTNLYASFCPSFPGLVINSSTLCKF